MNKLNKEDIEFLKDLQNKINSENTIQAKPRFYVVKDIERRHWVDEDNDYDGISIFNNSTYETEYEGEIGNLDKWLKDNIDEIDNIGIEFGDLYVYLKERYKEDEFDYISISSKIDLEDFLNEYYDNYEGLSVCCYKDESVIKENTLFLTREECDKHIKENMHHYNKSYSYSMTAWRSPQVERLFKILENTDWSEYNE